MRCAILSATLLLTGCLYQVYCGAGPQEAQVLKVLGQVELAHDVGAFDDEEYRLALVKLVEQLRQARIKDANERQQANQTQCP